MDRIYLERLDLARNRRRFYAIAVAPTLLGDWVVVREWGRIGSPGTVREDRFASEALARQAAATLRTLKERRGYRAVSFSL